MPLPEPAVSRRTLALTAALLWSLAGLVLITRATLWLRGSGYAGIIVGIISVIVGLLKGRFVFARLARRNIERLAELSPHKPKICIFAFQALQSYLIVIAMVALGILLRLSPIPRIWLAAIYLAIGSALITASSAYWRAMKSWG